MNKINSAFFLILAMASNSFIAAADAGKDPEGASQLADGDGLLHGTQPTISFQTPTYTPAHSRAGSRAPSVLIDVGPGSTATHFLITPESPPASPTHPSRGSSSSPRHSFEGPSISVAERLRLITVGQGSSLCSLAPSVLPRVLASGKGAGVVAAVTSGLNPYRHDDHSPLPLNTPPSPTASAGAGAGAGAGIELVGALPFPPSPSFSLSDRAQTLRARRIPPSFSDARDHDSDGELSRDKHAGHHEMEISEGASEDAGYIEQIKKHLLVIAQKTQDSTPSEFQSNLLRITLLKKLCNDLLQDLPKSPDDSHPRRAQGHPLGHSQSPKVVATGSGSGCGVGGAGSSGSGGGVLTPLTLTTSPRADAASRPAASATPTNSHASRNSYYFGGAAAAVVVTLCYRYRAEIKATWEKFRASSKSATAKAAT